MNDTSPEIENYIRLKMQNKSSIERLKMGFSMFETARNLIKNSIPPETDSLEKKIIMLRRMYSSDFSTEEIKTIENHLRNIHKNS